MPMLQTIKGSVDVPTMTFPRFREGKVGELSFAEKEIPPIIQGYLSTLSPSPKRKNWVLSENGKVWMSLTPMEVESQQAHIAAAYGNVVVLGLGMGVAVFNMAQKVNVHSIIVVERNETIIELVRKHSSFFKDFFVKAKVTVVCEDAFQYKQDYVFDVGYADIWMQLGAACAVADMRKIAKTIKADQWGWWGQEIDFIAWCGSTKRTPPPTAKDVKAWQKYLGFSVTGSRFPEEFAWMSAVVAENVYLS